MNPSRLPLRRFHRLLVERREEVRRDLRSRLRDVRADDEAAAALEAGDDVDLMLIQLHSATLQQIDAALERLEKGRYGMCGDCGEPIADARLRVLPFALRCTRCEGAREAARSRPLSRGWSDALPRFE